MKRLVVFSCPVLLMCLMLFSCQEFQKFQAHSVCEVVGDARKYSLETEVSVTGKVTNAGGVFDLKGFELQDAKGNCKLMVRTTRVTPEVGTIIVVKGKLTELVSFNDIKVLYLEEN